MSFDEIIQKIQKETNNKVIVDQLKNLDGSLTVKIRDCYITKNYVIMNVTYFLRPIPNVELSILLTVPIDYPNNPPKIDLKCPSDCECYHVIYMCGLRYYPIEIEYWNEYKPTLKKLLNIFDQDLKALYPFHPKPTQTLQERVCGIKIIPQDQVKFEKLIGCGGFSDVYKGVFKGKTVALKLLKNPDYFVGGKKEDEMIGEVRTQVILSNYPYICKFHGFSKKDRVPIYIFDYIQNGSLAKYLYTHNDVNNVKKRSYALQCAYALFTLHQFNIIHGDLKTDNYLLDDHRICKLCDFGNITLQPFSTSYKNSIFDSAFLSNKNGNIYLPIKPEQFAEDFAIIQQCLRKTTNKQTSCGTIGWIAPEILQSCHYSLKSDIYAFGSVLYEIFFQKLPYYERGTPQQVANDDQLLKMLYLGTIHPSIPTNTNIPPNIIHLMESCWTSPPEKRPSIEEIISELHQWNPVD